LAPSSFRAAPSGPSAVTAKRKYGSKVTYTLNQAASVRFNVSQRRPGRKAADGRCAAPTHRNRKARKCTRQVTLPGSFTLAGKAGSNGFRFTGRIGHKRLHPGRYKLAATPKTNGQSGRSVSRPFRIVK
jgi:hypothetical protein